MEKYSSHSTQPGSDLMQQMSPLITDGFVYLSINRGRGGREGERKRVVSG